MKLEAQAMYLRTLAAETPRAGEGRVFISDMFDRMVAVGEDDGMTLEGFKALLLECRKAGLVTLSRCDLVGAHDPRTVERSACELRLFTITEFHFFAV